MKNEICVSLNSEQLDEALEKAKKLIELLNEAKELICSLNPKV